jgi:hypothetical protein
MRSPFTQALAVGAASVALAGGIAFCAAGEAAAAPSGPVAASHHITTVRCHWAPGHWTRVWHAGLRDHRGHRAAGHWTRVWHKGVRVCGRR